MPRNGLQGAAGGLVRMSAMFEQQPEQPRAPDSGSPGQADHLHRLLGPLLGEMLGLGRGSLSDATRAFTVSRPRVGGQSIRITSKRCSAPQGVTQGELRPILPANISSALGQAEAGGDHLAAAGAGESHRPPVPGRPALHRGWGRCTAGIPAPKGFLGSASIARTESPARRRPSESDRVNVVFPVPPLGKDRDRRGHRHNPIAGRARIGTQVVESDRWVPYSLKSRSTRARRDLRLPWTSIPARFFLRRPRSRTFGPEAGFAGHRRWRPLAVQAQEGLGRFGDHRDRSPRRISERGSTGSYKPQRDRHRVGDGRDLNRGNPGADHLLIVPAGFSGFTTA